MGVCERNARAPLELTLDIWHPECWTLHVTADTNADLLGHGLYSTSDTVYGLFTASSDSVSEVNQAIADVRASPLTTAVWPMPRAEHPGPPATTGTATEGVLVEWGIDAGENIVDSLVAHGFLPRETYRMLDGREQWRVVTTMGRHEAEETLEDVSAATDSDIRIVRIAASGRQPRGPLQLDALSPRQREVFEYACQQGYYDWPRNVSATDLANDLELSKSTVVEHLRKAESRLFTPYR
jgi:predicted DNA binding protein